MNLSQRAAIAARFKVLCLDAGLKVPDVARTLQVTERTVYAWFSGKTAVPYATYRLLRILNRFELPGWPGWHMHSGKLWSPEGFVGCCRSHRHRPKLFELSRTV